MNYTFYRTEYIEELVHEDNIANNPELLNYSKVELEIQFSTLTLDKEMQVYPEIVINSITIIDIFNSNDEKVLVDVDVYLRLEKFIEESIIETYCYEYLESLK